MLNQKDVLHIRTIIIIERAHFTVNTKEDLLIFYLLYLPLALYPETTYGDH